MKIWFVLNRYFARWVLIRRLGGYGFAVAHDMASARAFLALRHPVDKTQDAFIGRTKNTKNFDSIFIKINIYN
jgi:hypothetical protein